MSDRADNRKDAAQRTWMSPPATVFPSGLKQIEVICTVYRSYSLQM